MRRFDWRGNVAGFGLGETEIVSLLTTWNYRNSPPLTEQELLQCVRSALVNGTPRPPKEDRPGMKDLRPSEYRDDSGAHCAPHRPKRTNGRKSHISELRQPSWRAATTQSSLQLKARWC